MTGFRNHQGPQLGLQALKVGQLGGLAATVRAKLPLLCPHQTVFADQFSLDQGIRKIAPELAGLAD